jgi:hypothetical protein
MHSNVHTLAAMRTLTALLSCKLGPLAVMQWEGKSHGVAASN